MERDISSFTCPNAAAGARVYEGVFTSAACTPRFRPRKFNVSGVASTRVSACRDKRIAKHCRRRRILLNIRHVYAIRGKITLRATRHPLGENESARNGTKLKSSAIEIFQNQRENHRARNQ